MRQEKTEAFIFATGMRMGKVGDWAGDAQWERWWATVNIDKGGEG